MLQHALGSVTELRDSDRWVKLQIRMFQLYYLGQAAQLLCSSISSYVNKDANTRVKIKEDHSHPL